MHRTTSMHLQDETCNTMPYDGTWTFQRPETPFDACNGHLCPESYIHVIYTEAE